jgi:hypothetical protein
MNKKICIQTQVFASKKSKDVGDLPIITCEHKTNLPLLIQDAMVEAIKYYEANDTEVSKAATEEIKRLEKDGEKKLSAAEKKVVSGKVLNRLATKKAEELGTAKWNRILELQDNIIKIEYEILKMFSEFANAEEI